MFPAQQDRTKAADDAGFPGTPHSPTEEGAFRNLEQSRTALANNEQWLADNADKIVPASQYELLPRSEGGRKGPVLFKEDDFILRSLGAAVMMRWNTLPAKLQRELFDHASSLGEFDRDCSFSSPGQTARSKELIARFLHNHKGPPTE